MNCMPSLMFGSLDVLYHGYIYGLHLSPWHLPSTSSIWCKRFLIDKNSFIFKVRHQNLPIKSCGFIQSGHVSFSTNATSFWSLYPQKIQIQISLHCNNFTPQSHYCFDDSVIKCYHHPDEIKPCLYGNDFECWNFFLVCTFKINLHLK